MRVLVLVTVLGVMACKQRKQAPSELPAAPPVAVAAPAIVPQCTPGERTCVGDSVIQCRADGTIGATLESCHGACKAGACVDTCAMHDVELVYVIDAKGILYSFDPKKLTRGEPFTKVAALDCNPTSTLNSMAVDRYGIAWLGYHDGSIARASIADGHCSPGTMHPEGGPKDFGMGFVTDGPKADTEKLFLAGGETDGSKVLATLAASGTWTPVGPIDFSGPQPELTGTGDGRVFAYAPSPARGFVQELDRATAKPIGRRVALTGEAQRVSAYAFAHWGGVFYVFSTVDDELESAVHAVHLTTGKQELVREHVPMRIVGAGVSTCAPLLEKAP